MSGVRIYRIAALPDDMREAVAKILSIPYISGLKYTDWNEKILNWVQKEEGNPYINKRRPLMYYEVMKKYTTVCACTE